MTLDNAQWPFLLCPTMGTIGQVMSWTWRQLSVHGCLCMQLEETNNIILPGKRFAANCHANCFFTNTCSISTSDIKQATSSKSSDIFVKYDHQYTALTVTRDQMRDHIHKQSPKNCKISDEIHCAIVGQKKVIPLDQVSMFVKGNSIQTEQLFSSNKFCYI